MKQEDIGTVQRLIAAELKNFSKIVDSEIGSQLEDLAKALDGANKNIFKLQAQATALKELLVQRGIISRENFNEESASQLEALIKLSHESKANSEAGRGSEAHAGGEKTSAVSSYKEKEIANA